MGLTCIMISFVWKPLVWAYLATTATGRENRSKVNFLFNFFMQHDQLVLNFNSIN
jgi:hypothetical protein